MNFTSIKNSKKFRDEFYLCDLDPELTLKEGNGHLEEKREEGTRGSISGGSWGTQVERCRELE